MKQLNNEELIIKKNILHLADFHKKSQKGERNLLNKWFQDSIKTYIFEQIASPLIAKYLNLSSSAQVKAFIHQQTEPNKPKYMGIIEQYFIQIIKYNQKDLFLQKLYEILLNPVDITQQKEKQNYNTEKIVRKQFVCFLILRYFELFGQQDIPSFYELWNICFPLEIQTKKKLSKFDKKVENKTLKFQISNEGNLNTSLKSSCDKKVENKTLKFEISNEGNLNTSLKSSSCFLNSSVFHSSLYFNPYSNIQKQQEEPSVFISSKIDGFSQSNNIQQSENLLMSYQDDLYPQNQPINNNIYEEDQYEEESMNHFLQFYYNQQATYQNQNQIPDQNIYSNNHLEHYEINYE
ncbi:hypothetical protein TTHERM_00609420 (macronuclear) [Tetrahymena thermophila SB210]|uniref:Uncharacterized protein n=1 Tax=Tetrahymena thermophila (strain SB210) TaxID=312017 RepID=Q22YE7_TETTS|nr:hypothetical protein TTHERM_00609420 [Tetrahymena thermophila SB210]EAR90338.1 hypothetical protein TTHERM_00609420 [Tetrahymena thermophila SB210]|eukprot:XP_001010583.1 hypothetical protein TTHERM_00609420 [Tetrahymena thermophila SB210]